MKIVAIVLNWNGLEDTLDCVRSLVALDDSRLHVLVVDNGSREFDAGAVEALGPRIDTVLNSENLGFCEGNNVGIAWALERGADWVWVLNNDLTVRPDTLDALLRCAAATERCAAAGGKVFYADRPGVLWMTWGRVTWLQSLIAIEGQDRPDGPSYSGTKNVDWIPGCAILMSASALAELGGFDSEFFAYHEDVDWCTRARRAGWQVAYTGEAAVDHRVHASSGGQAVYGGFRKYLSARNTILYARRHAAFHQWLLLFAAIVATLPFQYLKRAASGESAGVTIKVRGWLDGMARRDIPLRELGLRD